MDTRTGYRGLYGAHATRIVGGAAMAVLFVWAVFAANPAWAGVHKLTEEDNREVTIKGETKVYVKNSRGKTIIVGKKSARDISIRALKYVRAGSREDADKWMADLTFSVDSDGEHVSIVTNYPGVKGRDSFWSFIRGIRYKAYIEYTIEVPSRFDVKVASASGDVQVTSVDGRCEVFGSSGDVLLKRIGGDAFVEMSSGDVEIVGVQGDLRLRTSSGDALIRDAGGSVNVIATSGDMRVYGVLGDASIELASGDFVLEGCEGNAATRTSSGDGVLKDVRGSIRAVAGSGDIRMTIWPVGEKEFVVKTASGDVRVSFETPDRYGFQLEVNTASGSIEGDLDIQLDKVSRRMLRGVVGSGDSKLSIETASGDVVIRQAKREK